MKKIGNFFKKIGLAIAHFFKKIALKIKSIPKKAKIGYSCLIVGFLAIGGFGGWYLSNQVFKEKIVYGNPLDYEDDFQLTEKKFKKLDVKNDLSSKLETYEIVNIAVQKYKEHENTYSQQFGLVNATAGVKQTIRATAIKNGSEYFLEDISGGGKVMGIDTSAARRFYQSGNEVKDYEGQGVQETTAEWSTSRCTTRTVEGHETTWGKDLSRPLIYIISSKTVLDGSTCQLTSGVYKVKMSLDPKTSIIRYVSQMESISGVKNIKFEFVNIEFDIDQEFNLKHFNVKEKYSVDKGPIEATSSGEIDEYFTFGEEHQIPEINTNIEYVKENYL